MKGLFIKDIKSIWKAIIVCMAMMLLGYPISIYMGLGEEELNSIIFFVADLIIVCGIIPATTLTDDYRYGFIKYAKILPISKKAVIGTKYILSFIIEVIFVLEGIIMAYITSNQAVDNLWWIMYVVFPFGLVINGLLLFCITKFGTEHGAFTSIILIALLVAIMAICAYLDSNYDLVRIVSDNRVWILISGLVLYAISFFATTKVYINKEY